MLNRLKSILQLVTFRSKWKALVSKVVTRLDELDAKMETLEHETLYRKEIKVNAPSIETTSVDDLEAKLDALVSDFENLLSLLSTYGFTSPFLRELASLIEVRNSAKETAAQVQPAAIDTSDMGDTVETPPVAGEGTETATTEVPPA